MVAFGLRLYQLGHENFWGDEVAYVRDASQPAVTIIDYRSAPRTRVHHVTPLPHLITHFALSSEPRERSARLPSAIFGTLDVLAVFICGALLFSFSIGALAALLLALSPLHLWYSQEARWYAQWSFLTTCSYAALVYALKNNRAGSWIAYGSATLINLYTFIYSCLVVALQALTAWWSSRTQEKPQRFLVKFTAVHLVVGLAVLPLGWMIVRGLEKSSGTPRSLGIGDLPYTFFAYAAGFTVGPTVGELHALTSIPSIIVNYPIVGLFFLIFGPILLVGLLDVLQRPLPSAFVLPWLGLPILVFLIASVTNLTYHIRYTLPSLAPFVLITACGVLAMRSKTLRVVSLSGVILCSLYSIQNFFWNTRYDKEHVRVAVARIRSLNTGHIPIISMGQIDKAVRYYGSDLEPMVWPKNRCDPSVAQQSPGSYMQNGQKRIWLVAGRDWSNRAAKCLKQFSRSYIVLDHQRFPGTDVWLLERRQ
jgi:uncharacterized membrane protein